ncbi:hypothetical protein [Caballeronia sp. LZ032]|uniref:hypothetical protein n=1 Tax=Caballeronia sp. LZ032 TaxID=3038565 RepID=UPI002859AE75|nr:hypothetical protein [Caballeronia sp. LZ032]MDR5884245.1 hypothetical protein [Caballeronia sp. LZ032]
MVGEQNPMACREASSAFSSMEHFLRQEKEAASNMEKLLDSHGRSLIIFCQENNTWTVVADQFSVGVIEGVLSVIDLDSLGNLCTGNPDNLSPEKLKMSAEYIKVGENGREFWTLQGIVTFLY